MASKIKCEFHPTDAESIQSVIEASAKFLAVTGVAGTVGVSTGVDPEFDSELVTQDIKDKHTLTTVEITIED